VRIAWAQGPFKGPRLTDQRLLTYARQIEARTPRRKSDPERKGVGSTAADENFRLVSSSRALISWVLMDRLRISGDAPLYKWTSEEYQA